MKKSPLLGKLEAVVKLPGVYVFKGPKEKVLYVGKAKNLRSRLGSYFQKSASLDRRKSAMMRLVRDFNFIVTSNELEALILEASLIKQYKPQFNIIFRDDKNYPYIKVAMGEEWPRLEVVRRIIKDGSLYFGPYVPSGSMYEALDFIRRHYNIRPCKYRLDRPMRPCIQYQMKRCPGPCAGYVSRKDYMETVNEIVKFLRGERRDLIRELDARMKTLSDQMRYEEAASVRDRIDALKRAWESQRVISLSLGDLDVIGHFIEDGGAAVQVFFIRAGIMTGTREFHLKNAGHSDKEIYGGFIETFYSKEIIPPPEILLPVIPDGHTALSSWLSHRRGGSVKLIVPKRGEKKELVAMAVENAKIALASKAAGGDVLTELKDRLGLASAPRSIGAFDVSTISGTESVGAYILWEDGEFRKEYYRHVKIRTVEGVDDYAMMAETAKRVLDGMTELPDVILIDGGKGHLEAVRRVLGGIQSSIISVAKKPDRVFLAGAEEPLNIEDRRPSSLLLRRIRDEVHRFAIGFHRKLRAMRFLSSPLEGIPGISKTRRVALLKHFGSIEAIRRANVEELAGVKGMNRKVAAILKETLEKKET